MANLLQSSQVKTTCAPEYYTKYLSNLASAGQAAQEAAQYVGAQPLQEQAFCRIGATAGATQPMFQAGAGLVGQAGAQNVIGAAAPFLQGAVAACALQQANPYLQGAAMSGGLAAAAPFLSAAAVCSPATLAQQYMNPYIQCAVQRMSDIAQRNIQQNIAPQATAAAVGTGQYGSQRGAQVLGQLQAQAQQDLNANIANMLSQGYGQALTAAQQRQALLGQLGQTAGSLGQQQAGLLGQLGQTAGSLEQQRAQLLGSLGQTAGGLTAQQADALRAAGLGLGTLGGQAAQQNLACINALATLGGQQQTIAQNQQLFPLSTLSNLASLLQGYQIPTATRTQLERSGLENIGTLAGVLGGIFQTPTKGGCSLANIITGGINKLLEGKSGTANSGMPQWLIDNMFGGAPVASDGGTGMPQWLIDNMFGGAPVASEGASGGLVSTGSIGCKSTQSRGALPSGE